MADEKYNGWKNHHTWALYLHLTNTEEIYNYWREETKKVRRSSTEPVVELAKLMKEDVTGFKCAVFKAAAAHDPPLKAKILMIEDFCSLDEIDWCEVAQAFIDELKSEHQTPFRNKKPKITYGFK